MILCARHIAFISLLLAVGLIGSADAGQSRIRIYPSDVNTTQLVSSTSRAFAPSTASSSASSLAAVDSADDSWFSWANWRRILVRSFSESKPEVSEGRTFGLKRRLQMAIIPLVFKFGVLSTLIFMLVALGLKTVFLLKVLLVLNLAGVIAKLFIWKSELTGPKQSVTYASWVPAPPYPSPVPYHSAAQSSLGGKEVHLHIHNGGHHDDRDQGSWEPAQYQHNTKQTTGHLEPYLGYSNPVPSYVHRSQRRSYSKIPLSYNSQQ